MNISDKVLQLVKMRGPLIPVQIAKEIGTNILLASAILSELTSKNMVKLSNVKVGGSPLYYVDGQESKLQEYSDNLHEKEKKAYNFLKDQKVLRDTELEPVIRVALRQIKDYAKPLEVTVDGKTEIFWKWYLVSNAEAEPLIKSEMGIKTPTPQKKQEEAQETLQETQHQVSQKPEKPKPTVKKPRKTVEDTFSTTVSNFLKRNEIETIEFSIMKKNSEIDIIADVPSAVGKLRYYCKAKNK
ncbi:MAG: hypothetical protein GY861_26800, partial [bacterium]|nr:hypothetical protein [bacterium]